MRAISAWGVIAMFASASAACGGSGSFSGSNGRSESTKNSAADAVPQPVAQQPLAPHPQPAAPAVPPPAPSIPSPQSTPSIPPQSSPQIFVPPQGAVTKGSFTVWTIPSDPRPLEPYVITIEVRLPAGTTSYSASDLGGQVLGTDGYTQIIGNGAQPFQFLGTTARLQLPVPGAWMMVRDSITVKSALLQEVQTLVLEF